MKSRLALLNISFLILVAITAGTSSLPAVNAAPALQAATSISTTIVLKSGASVSGPVPLGSIVNDTAVVNGQLAGIPATGRVTYRFFNTTGCAGKFASEDVSLNAIGAVPNSRQSGPLAAGSYSFNATYGGDSVYASSTSACEPLTVQKGATIVTTTIVLKSGASLPTSVPLGSIVNDTAIVGGEVGGFVISGAVTYRFFTGTLACVGKFTSKTVALTETGSVPNSPQHGPLAAGSYSFNATYGGNSKYSSSTSTCERLTVQKAASTITTIIVLKSGAPLPASVPLGSIVNDTAVLSGQVKGFPATGKVIYRFFNNAVCAGKAASMQTVTITAGGAVPDSARHGPLAAGSYSFNATYSGSSNYVGSTSTCESLIVQKAATTITTTIVLKSGAPLPATIPAGTIVNDTATVGVQVSGFAIGGKVTYSFYSNGICSGTALFMQTVTLTSTGAVPNSRQFGPLAAGSYSFNATYSGSSNYTGSTSSCESLTIS